MIKYVSAKKQVWVHIAALAISLATLPIVPSAIWKPTGGDDPTGRILLLLGATVGLPYALLSSTSPLLQAWYVRTHKGAVPYRLFALSNFGSMLALLSYPALVEPKLGLHSQAVTWSVGYGLFALVCSLAGWKSRDEEAPVAAGESNEEVPPPPSLGTKLFWIGLAAVASTLLLSVTSHLTQNVAPIPLLWIVPLSLYLLSFILCFESDKIYDRRIFIPLFAVSIWLFSYGMHQFENNSAIRPLVLSLCGGMFVCAMVCHGELAKRRPHPKHLTQFYLMVSVGGAVGGLFVAMLAPRIFNSYLEMPIAVFVCAALAAWALWENAEILKSFYWLGTAIGIAAVWAIYIAAASGPAALGRNIMDAINLRNYSWSQIAAVLGILAIFVAFRFIKGDYWFRVAMAAGCAATGGYLARTTIDENKGYLMSTRNFYGVLRVREDPADDTGPAQRVLIHGTINHGTQILVPGSERIATSYFGTGSGISRAIRAKGENGPIRLGILGLGAGVTATLAREGDTLHYYEINPLVPEIADKYFGFFKGCPAKPTLQMGDGRLVLEKMEKSEDLDFLAMDAFTSDAVPVHLLTKEAFAIYRRHLKPNGLIAVNISNRYLDLEPVVARSAESIGFKGIAIADDGTGESYYTSSTWVIMSGDEKFFEHKNFANSGSNPIHSRKDISAWADDYSNIIQILTY